MPFDNDCRAVWAIDLHNPDLKHESLIEIGLRSGAVFLLMRPFKGKGDNIPLDDATLVETAKKVVLLLSNNTIQPHDLVPPEMIKSEHEERIHITFRVKEVHFGAEKYARRINVTLRPSGALVSYAELFNNETNPPRM